MNLRDKTIQELAGLAIDGEHDELKVYIELKRREKLLKTVLPIVHESALDVAESHGEKLIKFEDLAEVSIKNNAGRWNFKSIQSWTEGKETLSLIEEGAKDAYKAQAKGQTISDGDGVIIEPAEYTPGKTGLNIKLL